MKLRRDRPLRFAPVEMTGGGRVMLLWVGVCNMSCLCGGLGYDIEVEYCDGFVPHWKWGLYLVG